MSPARYRQSDILNPDQDPRVKPAIELLGRTGADQFQLRYCDEYKPRVWIASALWNRTWECAAAINPIRAIFRLIDSVLDGGTCLQCGRPTGFEPSLQPETMPMNKLVCWFQWDPELKTFRRGCEGDTEKSKESKA